MSECVRGGYAERERVRAWFRQRDGEPQAGPAFAVVAAVKLGAIGAAVLAGCELVR